MDDFGESYRQLIFVFGLTHGSFVGGVANEMLFNAALSQSPASGNSADDGTSSSTKSSFDRDAEFPLFIRGRVWPELPYLPKPAQLARPPRHVSDILVTLYFEKLHYTFPVLYKPHFMRRYTRLLRQGSGPVDSADHEFLLVFFAVCACASSLLPPLTSSQTSFAGLEYYEKALLLHHASPGQASLESVQCLALLSMCAAGWNTLTRSWTLAGQAVRSAVDIGLHVDSTSPGADSARPAEVLEQEIRRRTWWSIFCLER